ncbi:MAG: DMT family transporter [Oscillospiraceae bacterium]
MTLLGEGLILIGSIAYGASCVTIKLLSRREDTTALTAFQLIFGSLVMLLIGLLMGGRLEASTWPPTLLLFYLAAASSVAFILWSLPLKYNNTSGSQYMASASPSSAWDTLPCCSTSRCCAAKSGGAAAGLRRDNRREHLSSISNKEAP